MPLVASAARASDPVVVSSMPQMPSQPFFSSTTQSEWVTTSRMPPAGSWQLAPQGLINPFTLGQERLYGDAAYTTKDRNKLQANEPEIVSIKPTRLIECNENRNLNEMPTSSPKLIREGTICIFADAANHRVYLFNSDHQYVDYNDNRILVATSGVVAADTVMDYSAHDGGYNHVPIIVAGEAMMNIGFYNDAEKRAMRKIGSHHIIRNMTFRTLRSNDSDTIYVYIYP